MASLLEWIQYQWVDVIQSGLGGRKLVGFQQILASIIYLSILVFLVETIVYNQSNIIASFYNPQSERFKIVLICTVICLYCLVYSVSMAWLVGVRGSAMAVVYHCCLIGVYLVSSFSVTVDTQCTASSHQCHMAPLSQVDTLLVILQLIMGSLFVTVKRKVYANKLFNQSEQAHSWHSCGDSSSRSSVEALDKLFAHHSLLGDY